jgi:hypothetical protein
MDVYLSIHLTIAHVDHSPINDSLSSQDLFDQAYCADVYPTLPDSYMDTVDNTLSS